MNVDSYSTPDLVREFARTKVIGSQRRLTNKELDRLSHVVNELRLRRVLD